MNISDWIRGRANLSPNRVAIYFRGRRISYADLDRRIDALTAALHSLGVAKADRVALLEYNTPDYIGLLFACARLGATLVPLNWRQTTAEHRWQLDDCEPKAFIAGEAFREHCEGVREARNVDHWVLASGSASGWQSLDELVANASAIDEAGGTLASAAMIVYTSGTTGFPKGAVLTQSALFWCCVNSQQTHQMTGADRVLTDLPLFHVGGMNIQTLPALHAGAAVILHHRFDPDEAFDSIESLRPSIHLGVPTTLGALINHPRWASSDLTSLRLLMAGSTVVPHEIIDAFFDRGVTTGQVYGATETGPLVIALDGEHADAHRGSCGKPPIHCEARIVADDGTDLPPNESGEIFVRGPNLFSGYWKNEAATAAAMIGEWFRTGDIGHRDKDGFYYVDDRKTDVIISGGENVYPAEVENALGALPGVLELTIVAKPHPRWGEVPVAIVVPNDPDRFNPASLATHLEGRLARYKIPHEVIVRDALPRNAMGKVLKYQLRAWLKDSTG